LESPAIRRQCELFEVSATDQPPHSKTNLPGYRSVAQDHASQAFRAVVVQVVIAEPMPCELVGDLEEAVRGVREIKRRVMANYRLLCLLRIYRYAIARPPRPPDP